MAEALGYGYQKYIKDKVDAIEVDTIDLQTQIGVAGAGLTAITGSMALDATVAKDATVALDATVAKAATALTNATWTDAKAGFIDKGIQASETVVTGAIAALNNLSQAQVLSDATPIDGGRVNTGIPNIAPGTGDGLATANNISGLSGIRKTTFGVKTAAAITPNASYQAFSIADWAASVPNDVRITGIKITLSGAPTGTLTYRITEGDGTTKLFPYGAANSVELPTSYPDGVLKEFAIPVIIEKNLAAKGVEVQVKSTVVETITTTLEELDVVEFT